MNMGTPAWPESLDHFGTGDAIALEDGHPPRCDMGHGKGTTARRMGGPVVVNLTAGVTDVYVERPYDPGGFILT